MIKNLIEAYFIKITIKRSKWLLCCSSNPNKLHILSNLQELSNGIDIYSNRHENILLMGGLNVDAKDGNLLLFCKQCKLKLLKNHPTCSKNFKNPSGTDLLITNSGKSFEGTCTILKLKEKHKYLPPKVIQHSGYNYFDYAILVKVFINRQNTQI